MKVIKHEIKLEKSVKIILGVLALGVFLNVFAPVFDVRKAFALDSGDSIRVKVSGSLTCSYGCN